MIARACVILAVLPALFAAVGDRSSAGTLILRNTRWERVQVELRMGPGASCPENRALGTKALRLGQRWTVVSTEVVCWRREAVPGDAARGWTQWSGVQIPSATKQEVDL